MNDIADSERLAALKATGLMDTPPEPVFDRITRLARTSLKADVCLVSLVDDQRQFFKSAAGLPARVGSGTPLSHSFCRHVVETQEVFIVPNAREHPAVRDNPAVRDLDVAAYLGAPLHAPGGQPIGALCLIQNAPRAWSAEDQAALRDFAGIVNELIALRSETDEAVASADRYEALAQEYNHRAKNLIAVVTALVRLSLNEAKTLEQLSEAAIGRLEAFSSAHDAVEANEGAVGLDALLRRLTEPYAQGTRSLVAGGPEALVAERHVTPLCLIIHELATNSAKYGAVSAGETPLVSWTASAEGVARLTWTEPLPAGVDGAFARRGFGQRLLGMAARQLGGEIERRVENGTLTLRWALPVL